MPKAQVLIVDTNAFIQSSNLQVRYFWLSLTGMHRDVDSSIGKVSPSGPELFALCYCQDWMDSNGKHLTCISILCQSRVWWKMQLSHRAKSVIRLSTHHHSPKLLLFGTRKFTIQQTDNLTFQGFYADQPFYSHKFVVCHFKVLLSHTSGNESFLHLTSELPLSMTVA